MIATKTVFMHRRGAAPYTPGTVLLHKKILEEKTKRVVGGDAGWFTRLQSIDATGP